MDSLGRTHIQLAQLLSARLWLSHLPEQKLRQATGGTTGLHLTRQHGQSIEFDQVRDYQHGDDARHIDWRASARARVVQTRLFQRERDRPVFIVVEQGPAMFFASTGNFKSVQAALAASLFAWAASSVHDRVGGLVFDDRSTRLTTPARNRQGTLHLLHDISQANAELHSPFPATADNPLVLALEQCQPQLRPGTLLVLICSESHLDEGVAGRLGALAARHESIWLPVSDPLEHRLPARRRLVFAGQQKQLRLPRQSLLRAQWQQQAQQTRSLWQQLAARHRAILLPLSTATSLAQQLHGLQEGLHVACT